MTAVLGKNSVSGKQLVAIIEQIEALRAQKKQLGDDEKVVMAGAKAAGFIPQYINLAIKARAAKPHDFQDYEQTRDLYLHAVGASPSRRLCSASSKPWARGCAGERGDPRFARDTAIRFRSATSGVRVGTRGWRAAAGNDGMGPTDGGCVSAMHEFGEVLQPSEAVEPILARGVRNALSAWLEEIWLEDELVKVGLTARRKALFDGPPGVGKTTLAHHLAARLGLPMLVVRPERLKSRFIDASAENIGKLFDALDRDFECDEHWLVMFDEFDSIASERISEGHNKVASNDHNHSVNTFLARFEQFRGYCIAATNHGAAIDAAVWRRFQIQIALELPGQHERRRILERYLAPFVLPPAALEALAAAFDTATPALIREFAEGLKRNIVVGPRVGWAMNREATIERVLAAVHPHPKLGKPSLWALGIRHHAVKALPWPLSTETVAQEVAEGVGERVVSIAAARRG